MGLAMVAVAKLSLIGGGGHHGLTPLVTTLLWPFVLKFAFSFRPLQDTCADMVEALRLFLFQMSQIAFDRAAANGGATGGGPRWQRALRLVYERVTHARHAQSGQEGEDTLVALSMLAL